MLRDIRLQGYSKICNKRPYRKGNQRLNILLYLRKIPKVMNRILAILIVSLIVIACNKDSNNIILSGYVYSPLEKQYIANAKVELKGQLYDNNTWNSNYNTITYATTDATGKYYIEHEKVRTGGLKVVASKSGYIETEKEIDPDKLVPGEEYKTNMNIYPVAYLMIKIINEFPANDNDQITVTLDLGTSECQTCLQSSNTVYEGADINTMIFGKVYGNQTYTVKWTTNINGEISQHSQDVYCPQSDTGKLTITY